jgi:hypothetical protein
MQFFTYVHRHPTGQLPKFEKKKITTGLVRHAHKSTIVVTVELHKRPDSVTIYVATVKALMKKET